MLLEQIKGFYHGITKIFLLVGSYTMLSWHQFVKMFISSTYKNWLWDLDYITSKQHTKLYTQTVQGLADYAQKFTHYTSLAAPASYNYAA